MLPATRRMMQYPPSGPPVLEICIPKKASADLLSLKAMPPPSRYVRGSGMIDILYPERKQPEGPEETV